MDAEAAAATRLRAPVGACAWTTASGWIHDEIDLRAARARGEQVHHVHGDGFVHDITGVAPLSALMRVDRDLHQLTMRLDDLIERLANALDP